MSSTEIKIAIDAAKSFRKKHGFGLKPGPQIFDLCDQAKVLVYRLALAPTLSGAFIRSKRHNVEVVVVNTNGKSLHHQRFTLAHELGHLQLHKDQKGHIESLEETESTDSDNLIENQANIFAAELLVPLTELQRVLDELDINATDVPDRIVIQLGKMFGVSHHVVLRRLRIIARQSYEDMRERIEKTDWAALWQKHAPEVFSDTNPKMKPPISWDLEGVSESTKQIISRFPQVYREMAFEAYIRGKVTEGKLAELLELPNKEVVLRELTPVLRPDIKAEREDLEKALRVASEDKDSGD